MASLALLKRLEAVEAALGAGAQVVASTICPGCGANVALDAEERGPCPNHHPLPRAANILLVSFVAPAKP